MYVPACFSFWWLFPVLMIAFCLLMCFFMRRRGMAGWCMSGCEPRHMRGDRQTDGRTDGTSAPAQEKAKTEI